MACQRCRDHTEQRERTTPAGGAVTSSRQQYPFQHRRKPWHGAARLVQLVLRRLHQLRRRLVLGLRLDEGRVLLLALLRGLPASFFATVAPPLLLLCVLTRFNREAVRMLRRTEKAENAAQMSEPTLTKNKWKTPKNEKRTSATALSRALISACVRYWSDCATIISDENAWNNARVPVPS